MPTGSKIVRFVERWSARQGPAVIGPKHIQYTRDAIAQFWPDLDGIQSVLDVGCAGGEALRIFSGRGVKRCVGLTNQRSEQRAVQGLGFDCVLADMHFAPTEDDSFDLVFSRRTVEHSPVPFYLLAEFARISRRLVFIIAPEYPFRIWVKQHYAVLPSRVWIEWGKRLGLEVVRHESVQVAPSQPEMRLLFRLRRRR